LTATSTINKAETVLNLLSPFQTEYVQGEFNGYYIEVAFGKAAPISSSLESMGADAGNELMRRIASANADGPEATVTKAINASDSVAEAQALLAVPWFHSDSIIQKIAGGQGGVPDTTDHTSLGSGLVPVS